VRACRAVGIQMEVQEVLDRLAYRISTEIPQKSGAMPPGLAGGHGGAGQDGRIRGGTGPEGGPVPVVPGYRVVDTEHQDVEGSMTGRLHGSDEQVVGLVGIPGAGKIQEEASPTSLSGAGSFPSLPIVQEAGTEAELVSEDPGAAPIGVEGRQDTDAPYVQVPGRQSDGPVSALVTTEEDVA